MDSLVVALSNGDTTVQVDVAKMVNDSTTTWVYKNIRIKDFLPLTANMNLTVSTKQVNTSFNTVVGGLDKFQITDSLANGVITLNSSENSLNVYPNPFSEVIYLSNNNRGGLKSIAVINVLGEVVYQNSFSGQTNPIELNLSGLAKGVYFIRELTANGAGAKMIIKQ
jgi:hypothetical protein